MRDFIPSVAPFPLKARFGLFSIEFVKIGIMTGDDLNAFTVVE